MDAARAIARTEIVEETDAEGVARVAAERIAHRLSDAVKAAGGATLALSGGNTPRDTYVRLARSTGIDWAKVRVFWVDERAVPPDSDRSNYRAARATLLAGTPIPDDHVHRMEAERADLDRAACEYEVLLQKYVAAEAPGGLPGLDVVVLGMGADGHTASLFPGDSSASYRDRLVVSVPARGGLEPRLTLTPAVLCASRSVFVLVVGPEKRAALRRAWAEQGEVGETPIRVVRSCRGDVTWIVDRAAAAKGSA